MKEREIKVHTLLDRFHRAATNSMLKKTLGLPLFPIFAKPKNKMIMKKTLMTIILCAAMLQVQASPPYPVGMQVHLHVEVIGINPGCVGHQFPKSPVHPPIVYLDAHTLYICSEHSGYMNKSFPFL